MWHATGISLGRLGLSLARLHLYSRFLLAQFKYRISHVSNLIFELTNVSATSESLKFGSLNLNTNLFTYLLQIHSTA